MVHHVSDARSNPNEQIEHAVKVIGRSKDRLAVFRAVYKGKKRTKTVPEIADIEGLRPKRVLEEGKKLADNGIVKQVKNGRVTGYEKDPFYTANKNTVLRLIDNPSALAKLPTKSRPHVELPSVTVQLPKRMIKSIRLTIDDLDSFSAVRGIVPNPDQPYTRMLEAKFKDGVKRILKERSSFKDWGGENSDLLTTNVRYNSRRIPTAFAFKGPGRSGVLTPAKMGKNGDQIQRLYQSPAELFILQYWKEIHESTIQQMEAFASITSVYRGRTILFCIIDGMESNRIISAYESYFE